jgi:hypothetical protein
MTDLQDAICDRLVGAAIGPNWVGGPLHAAALVVDPSFVPASRGDTRPGQFARAVGWPVGFCEAVIGANAALGTEDDRRSLAISLFARVPPAGLGQRATPVARTVSRQAAVWAVLRAHESACRAECPLHAAAIAALEAVGAGGDWPRLFQGGIDCATVPGQQDARVTPRSPAAHHAVVAMRYLDEMMRQPTRHYLLADALRESAKAETKVHGLAGAVAFCLTLAEKLGLTVTERGGSPGA